MTIHKEGYRIIIISLITLILINLLLVFLLRSANKTSIISWSAVISLIVFILTINFFRSPKREGFQHSNAILAPADGKIVVIEEVYEDEFLKDKAIMISVFMSVFNVHINWYPINGKILDKTHQNGRFLSANLPKASHENERTSVLIEHKNNSRVLVRQIAGAIARRIVCYAKKNEAIEQGQEMGFIKFGSRVDIYLPLGTRIDVQLGQKVIGKQTIIGWFK